jgi:hypothetical protein
VRADGPFASPAFVLVLGFAAVVVLPMTLYFFWVHPAWSWMYLVDPDKVPSLAVVPVAVTHIGAVVGGWYLGARLLRADKRTAALWVAGGGGGLLLLAAILLGGRIGHYGSYARHSAGEELRGLMDVKLGWALIVVFLAFAVAAGYVALELSRDSRRVRTR